MITRQRTVFTAGISLGFLAGALAGHFVRFLDGPARSGAPGWTQNGSGAQRSAASERSPRLAPRSRRNPGAGAVRGEQAEAAGSGDREISTAIDAGSSGELLETLRKTAHAHDAQGFWLAASELGPLEPTQLFQVTEMLRESQKDPKAADLFSSELIRYGGSEGIDWIAQFVNDEKTDPALRNAVIGALEDIPPERREEAIPIVGELLKTSLRFDYFACARALGSLLGPNAVSGLTGVLDSLIAQVKDSGPTEAESWHEHYVLRAIQELATPDDRDLVVELFRRRIDRGQKAMLSETLSALAGEGAAKMMLTLLRNPPDGAIRDLFAESLDRVARPDDLPDIREVLEGEHDKRVQTVLTSLLARLAGPDELRQLAERALDPSSGLSPEAIVRALTRAERQDLAPLMLDLLPKVHEDYAAFRLARSVLQTLGRQEGTEKLVSTFAGARNYTMINEVARALMGNDRDHGSQRLVGLMDRLPDGVCRAAIADVIKNERGDDDAQLSGEVVPGLARILSTETDATSQEHLAGAIASFGPDGMKSLGDLLETDVDARRRFEVLRSMKFLAPEQTAAIALRVLHQDPSPELRSEAARIVGMGSDPSRLEELSSALANEEDSDVRGTIEEILRRNRGR